MEPLALRDVPLALGFCALLAIACGDKAADSGGTGAGDATSGDDGGGTGGGDGSGTDDGSGTGGGTGDDPSGPEPTIVATYGGTFNLIPAGTFTMGCTDGIAYCDDNEYPTHEVTLTTAFYVSATEVTQGEYESLMENNPSSFTDCGEDCPVERVTWSMAAAFANAASEAEGLDRCYDCTGSEDSVECTVAAYPYTCTGYRLPTEAEWEYSARCGEPYNYAGSDDAGDVGWYDSNSDSQSHRVASKEPNACGLYDMSGNVREWIHDLFLAYESSPRTDPTVETSERGPVYRGGAWTSTIENLRVTDRAPADPTRQSGYIGFRLVRMAL